MLYDHTEGDEGARKYQSRTSVPTGQEMDTVRKNRVLFRNKLEEIQLSSPSATSTSESIISEAPQSSKLMDTSVDPFPESYDTTLIDLEMNDYPAEVPAANVGGNNR